jgi:hypothetical protein
VVYRRHNVGERAHGSVAECTGATGAFCRLGERPRELALLAPLRIRNYGVQSPAGIRARPPACRLGHDAHHRQLRKLNSVVLTKSLFGNISVPHRCQHHNLLARSLLVQPVG